MPGYSIWYLLNEDSDLHDHIRSMNKRLGTVGLPAHIPIHGNLVLNTAKILFRCYDKKIRPTFHISERPLVLASERKKHLSYSLIAPETHRVWDLPIASRTAMFFNHELSNVAVKKKYILPEEYALVIMDCRAVDRSLWKPLD